MRPAGSDQPLAPYEMKKRCSAGAIIDPTLPPDAVQDLDPVRLRPSAHRHSPRRQEPLGTLEEWTLASCAALPQRSVPRPAFGAAPLPLAPVSRAFTLYYILYTV